MIGLLSHPPRSHVARASAAHRRGGEYSASVVASATDFPKPLRGLRCRYRLLHIAGQLTRHARRLTLHLPADWLWGAAIARAFKRLAALPEPQHWFASGAAPLLLGCSGVGSSAAVMGVETTSWAQQHSVSARIVFREMLRRPQRAIAVLVNDVCARERVARPIRAANATRRDPAAPIALAAASLRFGRDDRRDVHANARRRRNHMLQARAHELWLHLRGSPWPLSSVPAVRS
jgi:hypothetical protein